MCFTTNKFSVCQLELVKTTIHFKRLNGQYYFESLRNSQNFEYSVIGFCCHEQHCQVVNSMLEEEV